MEISNGFARADQDPLKFGRRFSRKAVTPSRPSDVVVVETIAFFSASNWTQVRDTLWQDATSHLSLYVLMTVLVMLLFLIQPRFRRNLTRIGEVASRPTCREFTPTARAAVCSRPFSKPAIWR